ncbi:MAG: 50S ribosomal protein L11 methyltransferase [Dehalococcoidia bacterium]
MPSADQRWVEVVARVAPDDVDAVSDALMQAGAEGVSIEPAIRVDDNADFHYEELDEPSLVRATFPSLSAGAPRRALRRRLDALALSAPLPRLRIREVGLHAWAEEWKRFYHVQHIGPRLVVRPSWEPYEPQPGEVVVELDPGTAFGTGQHETTRLCLVAIEAEQHGPVDVLDVGTGSGILAIAGALLGARRVRAIDNDPETIAIARENAAMNGVAERIEFAAGSLPGAPERGAPMIGEPVLRWPWPGEPPEACCDVLVANISSTVNIAMLPAYARAIRPGGTVILSGFIARDADEVTDAVRAAGLEPVRLDEEAEWRCLVARAPRG